MLLNEAVERGVEWFELTPLLWLLFGKSVFRKEEGLDASVPACWSFLPQPCKEDEEGEDGDVLVFAFGWVM